MKIFLFKKNINISSFAAGDEVSYDILTISTKVFKFF